jgi:hypothetical protein
MMTKMAEDEQGQHQQGHHAAAGHDAIRHLHHVDRGRQHQEVDHGAENEHRRPRRAHLKQDLEQGRRLGFAAAFACRTG